MNTYIRKCSLELLSVWFCDTDLEDELETLGKLLQEEDTIQILVNLAKDKSLDQILTSIDELVEARLSYKPETYDPAVPTFNELVPDELALSFIYRLAKLV